MSNFWSARASPATPRTSSWTSALTKLKSRVTNLVSGSSTINTAPISPQIDQIRSTSAQVHICGHSHPEYFGDLTVDSFQQYRSVANNYDDDEDNNSENHGKSDDDDDDDESDHTSTSTSFCSSTSAVRGSSSSHESFYSHENMKYKYDDDVIDVDEHNNDLSMIRVPLTEWVKMKEAKQKLKNMEKAQRTEKATIVPRKKPERHPKEKPNKPTSTSALAKKSKAPKSHDPSLKATRKSSRIRTLKCQHCQKKFKTQGNLSNHLKTHTAPSELLVCETCGRNDFKDGHILREHQKIHQANLTCKFCGKKYGARHLLLTHQRFNKKCKELAAAGAKKPKKFLPKK